MSGIFYFIFYIVHFDVIPVRNYHLLKSNDRDAAQMIGSTYLKMLIWMTFYPKEK